MNGFAGWCGTRQPRCRTKIAARLAAVAQRQARTLRTDDSMSPDAGSSLRCRSLGLVLVGLSCATACQDEPLGLTEPPVTGHSILRDVIVLPRTRWICCSWSTIRAPWTTSGPG